MKQINYDAKLDWIVTHVCNLNCTYCLQVPYRKKMNPKAIKLKKINIQKLLKTLNKTQKIFRINFTGGGEPFLIPNIIEACMTLINNHYISFITNLISKNVKEFAEKIDSERVSTICASLHINELEKHNLLERYINNFLLFKEKGFNITCTEVAYPQLLDEVEKYKKYFQENGIEIKFQRYLGRFKGKDYPKAYTDKEIKTFGLDEKMFYIRNQLGNLCNAGYNVAMVNPNGDIYMCTENRKSLGNIYKEIRFNNNLIICPFENCRCPVNVYDPYLFKKAVEENNNLNVVKVL